MIFSSNNQSKNELSIFVTSTANIYEDQSTFNTSYLLYGLNGALCLFLFALVFHLCKKSLNRENRNCMTNGEKNIQDEFHMQNQLGCGKSYDTISESAETVQVYRSLESEYDVIDEKLQIQNSRFSQTSDGYERSLSFENGTKATSFPIKDIRVKQSSK